MADLTATPINEVSENPSYDELPTTNEAESTVARRSITFQDAQIIVDGKIKCMRKTQFSKQWHE